MNAIQRAGKATRRGVARSWAGLKQLAINFGKGARRQLWGRRSRFNYGRDVGDGDGNSIVMAVLGWVARVFPEAPIVVEQRKGAGEWQTIDDHKMAERLKRPNPHYSGIVLKMATVIDQLLTGNAYWLMQKTIAGVPVRFWYIPSYLIEPADSETDFISHYEYRPQGAAGKAIRLEVDEVVHFRWGLDRNNPRKGLSPMASVLREVFTDDEAASYTATILRNLGVPGVVISPDVEQGEIEQEDADLIRDDFTGRFSGDGRGEPMILPRKVKIDVLSFSPEQMTLKDLRRVPEERISAVIGVPAIVAGLGAGLDRATYDNVAGAREMAYESLIIPLQNLWADDLDTQVLPLFGNTAGLRTVFDLSRVRVLQPDKAVLVTSVNTRVTGGWMTVAAGKRIMGEEPLPGDDVYLRSSLIVEVPADGSGRPPAPAPGTASLAPDDLARFRLLAQASGLMTREPATFKTLLDDRRAEVARRAASSQLVIREFFDDQAKRVIDRLGGKSAKPVKAAGDDLLPESELRELRKALRAIHVTNVQIGWDEGRDDLGGQGDAFDIDAPLSQSAIDELARNLKGVHDTTRQAVREHVTAGRAAGYSSRQIAEGVAADGFPALRDLGAFSNSRALMIARTEIADAEALGSIAQWRSTGLVEHVEIDDGDGCGWLQHDDPDAAQGSTRSLDDYQAHRLAHPNCVRVARPIVKRRALQGRTQIQLGPWAQLID